MNRMAAVTLRDPAPEEEAEKPASDMESFRAGVPRKTYIKRAAKKRGVSKSQFIIDAIDLDRALGDELEDQRLELRAFAEAEGLNLAADLPKVLAALIRAGLAAQRKKR